MYKKVAIPDKVQKEDSKKFKIKKDKDHEIDTEVEILEEGTYTVEKLSTDGLPTKTTDNVDIRWFNNFAIKKDGKYINQRFKVNIVGLSALQAEGKKIVIYDGNSNDSQPYIFENTIIDDTFELTDGDPAVGSAPP
jgi:hypothetical protein